MLHAVNRLHCEAKPGADFFHQRKIAAAPAAKTKIVADQHESRRQLFMQRVDEVLRAHPRKMRIETAHMDAVYAQRGKCIQLLAQAGQPCRRLLRREKFARMRLEYHHRRLQAALLRRGMQFFQQSLMAQMHTVEISDGERNGLAIRGIKSA